MELNLNFKNYITRIQLTEGRMPKYFEKGTKVPKKYDKCIWKKYTTGKGIKEYLYDPVAKKRVVKNQRMVDTPRYQVINGQAIYNGYVNKHSRAKMMKGLKEWFVDNIPAGYPIFPDRVTIDYVVVGPREEVKWDLDNHMMPYIKAFQDVLQDLGIIQNDTVSIVNEYSVRFYYGKDHRLIIKVSNET